MKAFPLHLASLLALAHSVHGNDANTAKPVASMNIRIRLGEEIIPATLRDTATARAFFRLLPLQLSLDDYAGTEKIADLPCKLPTQGAPAGSDPSPGDIAYYAPWGNLAFFYKDFGYSEGLIIIGAFDSDLEKLTAFGARKITIEPVGR